MLPMGSVNEQTQTAPLDANASQLPIGRTAAVPTVAEVAADLRSSKAHVSNIITGKIRGVVPLAVIRLGRRVLIRRATLEQWKSQCERTG